MSVADNVVSRKKRVEASGAASYLVTVNFIRYLSTTKLRIRQRSNVSVQKLHHLDKFPALTGCGRDYCCETFSMTPNSR